MVNNFSSDNFFAKQQEYPIETVRYIFYMICILLKHCAGLLLCDLWCNHGCCETTSSVFATSDSVVLLRCDTKLFFLLNIYFLYRRKDFLSAWICLLLGNMYSPLAYRTVVSCFCLYFLFVRFCFMLYLSVLISVWNIWILIGTGKCCQFVLLIYWFYLYILRIYFSYQRKQ